MKAVFLAMATDVLLPLRQPLLTVTVNRYRAR